MTKKLSTHAATVKVIRQHCKEKGIRAKVHSDSYAGGTSVNVSVEDMPLAEWKQLEKEVQKYQYGHFDGMTDCYNYDNRRDDIPQVKFVFVENEMSDAKKQEVYSQLRSRFGWDFPAEYENARDARTQDGEYVAQLVWREFCRA